MQILGLIIIGIVIGVIARLLLPGRQRIGAGMTVLLGVAGALVGGIVASAIGTGDIWELNFLGTIVGIVAAAGFIAAADAAGLGSGGRRDQLGPGR
ncbi:MAG TPA: GlsB/YeaQ/YmgE family stress response membrane protein [Thermoleophilaceae bacterium]|nr:GlsB/YeaQ/YmgE family stress response membrane protein [Thermoleophilaceae bacterium]